MLNYESCS